MHRILFQTQPTDEVETSNVFLSERDLAARWQLSVKSLQNWRVLGGGPAYVKIGRAVRYRLSDIVAFESAGQRTSSSSSPIQGEQ